VTRDVGSFALGGVGDAGRALNLVAVEQAGGEVGDHFAPRAFVRGAERRDRVAAVAGEARRRGGRGPGLAGDQVLGLRVEEPDRGEGVVDDFHGAVAVRADPAPAAEFHGADRARRRTLARVLGVVGLAPFL